MATSGYILVGLIVGMILWFLFDGLLIYGHPFREYLKMGIDAIYNAARNVANAFGGGARRVINGILRTIQSGWDWWRNLWH